MVLNHLKKNCQKNRRDAKERYLEVMHIASPEVFSEEKSLLFIQALDGREYKIDYTKIGTKLFVRIHQESYL